MSSQTQIKENPVKGKKHFTTAKANQNQFTPFMVSQIKKVLNQS